MLDNKIGNISIGYCFILSYNFCNFVILNHYNSGRINERIQKKKKRVVCKTNERQAQTCRMQN